MSDDDKQRAAAADVIAFKERLADLYARRDDKLRAAAATVTDVIAIKERLTDQLGARRAARLADRTPRRCGGRCMEFNSGHASASRALGRLLIDEQIIPPLWRVTQTQWFKDLMSVTEAGIANLMVQWRRWFQPSQG